MIFKEIQNSITLRVENYLIDFLLENRSVTVFLYPRERLPPLFIEDARKKASIRGSTGIEFREAAADSLPFDSESFSSVGSYEVFEHLYHPREAIGEIARVLKPGGKAVIAAPNYLSPLNDICDPLDNTNLMSALCWFLKKMFRTTFRKNIILIMKTDLVISARFRA